MRRGVAILTGVRGGWCMRPIGSWIDILVLFWVELALMLSVAAVATAMLVRARCTADSQVPAS